MPPLALGLSLNGFFLYLAALRVLGRAPHSSITAAWYALLGVLCLVGAWLERDTLRARLARASRPTVVYAIAGVVLAVWFSLNVVLISHGSLSRTFAGELVLWTLPTALLALSLPSASVRRAAASVAALGGVFALIEIAVLAHNPHASRFSPIARLDPISAGQIPAFGAVGLLALTPRNRREEIGRALALILLCAATVLPGSRGPVLALCVGLAAAAIVMRFRTWQLLTPAVIAGLALGYGGTKLVGSSAYLTSSVPGVSKAGEISTFHIRREWWASAVKAIPTEPIVGHGVAMLVDDTPEAKQMGVAGERTYPHNSPLESLYSLGVLGAVPYLVLLAAGITALVILVRRRHDAPLVFAAGLYAFAFASANVSGEIGADAAFWAAGALTVGLYADRITARK